MIIWSTFDVLYGVLFVSRIKFVCSLFYLALNQAGCFICLKNFTIYTKD